MGRTRTGHEQRCRRAGELTGTREQSEKKLKTTMHLLIKRQIMTAVMIAVTQVKIQFLLERYK